MSLAPHLDNKDGCGKVVRDREAETSTEYKEEVECVVDIDLEAEHTELDSEKEKDQEAEATNTSQPTPVNPDTNERVRALWRSIHVYCLFFALGSLTYTGVSLS